MIKQAKKLFHILKFKDGHQFQASSALPLTFLNSYSFGEIKNLKQPPKDSAYLAKIKLKFQEAENFLRKPNHLDEAIKRYQDILYSFNLGKEIKSCDCIKALVGVGDAYSLQKKMDKSLDYYLLALAFKPPECPELERAELHRKIGECYYEIAEFINSLEYTQKALDLYKSCNFDDSLTIGKLYLYLGRNYNKINDLYQAIENFKVAQDIFFTNEQNIHLIVQTKTELAQALAVRKEIWTSWTTLFEAMTLYEQSPDLTLAEKITLTEEFTKVLDVLGFYRELLERYEDLIKLLRQQNGRQPSEKVIDVLTNIAFTHVRLKDYPSAISAYLEALNEAETLDIPTIKGDIYLQVGICFWTECDYDEAKEYLLKAVEIKKNCVSSKCPDIGKAYYYIGRIYYSEYDYETSQRCFAKALRILRKCNDEDDEDILEIQKYLNKARQKLGDD